ncbi:hypothetical protein [uncultured Bacteroides sp.]|uniref:hypothetical protein n=1 Tax=uncultured Bacteroides sp. TaxID=162156 RepID=UPI002AA6A38F|nr:hypothetical protein [uncultured Bacteroides sp.]
MNLSKTKKNFFISLGLVTILTSLVFAFVFLFLLPEHYFDWCPFIPAYFVTLGVISIYVFDITRRRAPKILIQVYLTVKTVKFLLSIVVLLIYGMVVKIDIVEFLLTFMVFYLIYLIFETWFFFLYELNRKRKREHEKEENK